MCMQRWARIWHFCRSTLDRHNFCVACRIGIRHVNYRVFLKSVGRAALDTLENFKSGRSTRLDSTRHSTPTLYIYIASKILKFSSYCKNFVIFGVL